MLSFQQLEVYQYAIRFYALADDVIAALPRGHSHRAEQLSRSSESIVRNIAEGSGRWTRNDCAKHYKIARGEAMESAASFDILKLKKLVEPATYDDAIALLKSIVAMLTKMI